MLKPVAVKKKRNKANWKALRPVYQKYAGVAVTLRSKVPTRKTLLHQRTLAHGNREIK
jgi:hypothetical protein